MPKLGKIIPSEENANDPFDKLIDLLSGVADALIQASALDGVPVVGTLIGSVRVWAGWRERIFEEKVRSFIDEAKSAPQDYRDRLAKALGSVAKQRKFGKHLILMLERADDLDKPTPNCARLASNCSRHHDADTGNATNVDNRPRPDA